MTEASLDVVCIGNAIVDVIAHADDAFLAEHGMTKGAMNLIDEARANFIYPLMSNDRIELSGGCAGNTAAGIASLGGRVGYIGKVRNDALGDSYRRDLRAADIAYPTSPSTEGPSTALCLILVTPDAQRTLNTYLGACINLTPADIDEALVASAQVTYLEGYLYDPPHAQEAFRRAAAIAHEAGRKVSLTLSDSFCVERHRADFLTLLEHHVDIVFANEDEILSLFQTSDFDEAVARIRPLADVAAITRGPEGSVIGSGERVVHVPAAHVDHVVDTTGAGDLYAAGFLYGFTQGADLAECGRLGGLAAAEVISHFGARPQTVLRDYVAAGSATRP